VENISLTTLGPHATMPCLCFRMRRDLSADLGNSGETFREEQWHERKALMRLELINAREL